MEFTADKGITWERTSALNERKTGAIQPTILSSSGGKTSAPLPQHGFEDPYFVVGR